MPSGLPEVDSLATYGGAKQNYAPVEDTTVDEDADQMNICKANVAAMTQTAFRGWCAFVGKASSPPDDPASNVHGAVWGSGLTVKPTMARTGTGVYTATYPTTVTDELAVTHTVNLRRAVPFFEGSTAYFVSATVTAPNVVTIRVFNAAGAANDGVGVTFGFFVT